MTPVFSSVLWFLAVIASIPVALWLFKRSPLSGVGGGANAAAQGLGALRSVASLPLSPSQRIVTIEVGQGEQRQWLVLGVTAQSIATLHRMVPPDEVPAALVREPLFSQLLSKLLPVPASALELQDGRL